MPKIKLVGYPSKPDTGFEIRQEPGYPEKNQTLCQIAPNYLELRKKNLWQSISIHNFSFLIEIQSKHFYLNIPFAIHVFCARSGKIIRYSGPWQIQKKVSTFACTHVRYNLKKIAHNMYFDIHKAFDYIDLHFT